MRRKLLKPLTPKQITDQIKKAPKKTEEEIRRDIDYATHGPIEDIAKELGIDLSKERGN